MFSLFSAKFIFSFSKYSNVRLTFVDLRWAKLYVCLVCNNSCFLSSWLSKEDKDLDLLSRCSSLGRVSQGICLWLWGSSPCVARGFQSAIFLFLRFSSILQILPKQNIALLSLCYSFCMPQVWHLDLCQ